MTGPLYADDLQKKSSQLFWKKYDAWHELTIKGKYYDRDGDVCKEGHDFGPQLAQTCSYQASEWSTYSPSFANQFGLDKESITITHTIYLHGVMIPDASTDHCCDCYNPWGYKLFDLTVKLGECD